MSKGALTRIVTSGRERCGIHSGDARLVEAYRGIDMHPEKSITLGVRF